MRVPFSYRLKLKKQAQFCTCGRRKIRSNTGGSAVDPGSAIDGRLTSIPEFQQFAINSRRAPALAYAIVRISVCTSTGTVGAALWLSCPLEGWTQADPSPTQL
jgi:hypothetical protein